MYSRSSTFLSQVIKKHSHRIRVFCHFVIDRTSYFFGVLGIEKVFFNNFFFCVISSINLDANDGGNFYHIRNLLVEVNRNPRFLVQAETANLSLGDAIRVYTLHITRDIKIFSISAGNGSWYNCR